MLGYAKMGNEVAHRLVTELDLKPVRAVLESVERLLGEADKHGDFGFGRHALARARMALQ